MPPPAAAAPMPLGVLRGHAAPVNCVQTLPEPHASKLVSGAGDGVVKIWDLRTRRECASQQAHSAAGVLHTARFQGARMLTQGRDGFVKLWDVETFGQGGEPVQSWFCGCYSFTKAAAQRWDGDDEWAQVVVCPSAEDRNLLVFDARVDGSKEVMKVVTEDTEKKRGMCMSLGLLCPSAGTASDDNAALNSLGIAAGWEGGQFSLYDLRAGGKLAFETQVTAKSNPILAFDIAKDGRSAIVGSSDETLSFLNIDYTAQSISCRPFFTFNHGGISAVRLRPDQRILATAGWDHRIRIFHTRTLKPLAVLKYHTESVFGIDFTLDNNFLLSASKDHKIALWSISPPSSDAAKQALRTY